MPNNEVGRRSFNVPGRNFGGEGIAGKAVETTDERVARRVKMDRLCHYCEGSFTAEKEKQHYHDARCGALARSGRISDATFKRWEKGLGEVFRWREGENVENSLYQRPADVLWFDFARRRLYLTILEIQKRGERANEADGKRAFKLLAEGLLKLFTLPASVDLFASYDPNTTRIAYGLEQMEYEELGEVRGMAAWKIISDTHTIRWRTLYNNNRPKDLQYLDW